MRYHTAELLSKGATGEVYQAYDPVLRRQVALKFLLREDPVLAERMLREARAQARVDHPNICKVYEVGELDGRPYIAMQFVGGQDLREAAREMTLEQKVRVVRKVADALHSAHQEGLVHRDMKPANVMVEMDAAGDPHPVVVDFGLVQEYEAQDLTKTGEVMGTPTYMAPEQARGEVRNLDRRTDVYSLGATFYALLTGQPPFDGENTVELLMRVIGDDPPPPRRIDPNIPFDLETVILRCLEKQPGKRYPSARALAEDLDRYLEGSPIEARRASFISRVVKKARRHRALVAVSTLALIATVGLSAWALTERWQAVQERQLGQRFAQEGKDLEWMIRAVHTTPKHDIRPEKEKVRRRIKGLLAELEHLGATGAGPAHYAVGRGYLVLLEMEKAQEHLQLAWDMGFRTPEMAYALGLTLGELYEKELDRRPISPGQPGERERLREELDQRWKRPAMDLLRASREGETHAPEYVEGLIALYDQEWEKAREKAAEALKSLPWLYEARTLSAQSFLRQALQALEDGREELAPELFRKSEVAYLQAIDAAPSYPRAYSGLCVLRTSVFSFARRGAEEGNLEVLAQTAVDTCQEASAVDPELSKPYESLSKNYRMLSQYRQWRDEDATETLALAKEMARKAVELDAEDPGTHLALAVAYLQEAEQYTIDESIAPLPMLEEAREQFRKALEVEPSYSQASHGLGLVAISIAEFRSSQGEDPDASFSEAIRLLEEVAEKSPKAHQSNYNLGATLRERGSLALDQGREFANYYRAAIWRLERALQARPGDSWTLSELSLAHGTLGLHEILLDRDSKESMDLAGELGQQALEAGPKIPWFLYRRASIAYYQAIREMVEEEDPEPYFAIARDAVGGVAELAPEQADRFILALDVELLAAEWDLQIGQSAEGNLSRAAAYLEEVLLRTEGYDAAIAAAQFYRWQAEWWLRSPRPARQAVDRGAEWARQALELRPEDTYTQGLVGELKMLRALTEIHGDERQKEASEAYAILLDVMEQNRWRTLEFGESLERARRLAGEPKVREVPEWASPSP